ncbi:MAG: hypothetical protein JSR30_00040 [Proteobacteria bacterium]|nr:hypothetical protein [Pseudomonadota bacterium]
MNHEFTFVRLAPSVPLPPRPIPTPGVFIDPRRPLTAPAVWKELHRRALVREGDDSEWLADFGRRIAGSCECRQQWFSDLKVLPPDFTRYFEWTVAIHNAVNRRLEKPELSVEEAREIWGGHRENE